MFFYFFQINHVNAFQEASAKKYVSYEEVDSLYIYLNLRDLKDVEVKNNYFEADLWYEISSNKEFGKEGSDYNDYSSIVVNTRNNPVNDEGFFTIRKNETTDSLSHIAFRSLYSRFDHNWDLTNYPFDKQS